MKPTLLILAAGMGSRYGSLKQLDGVGPNNETIIDYSVYDAIRAGFGKVVFVIREHFLQDFQQRITNKFEDKIDITFAYQEVNTPIEGVDDIPEREKPWGTAHAVLVAEDLINEPFAAINADDYYGISSFQKIARFLTNDAAPDHYCMVGFQLSKTLSANGSVSRGVCQVDDNQLLKTVVERTNIRRDNGSVYYYENDEKFPLQLNSLVSMNFWGFHQDIFRHIKEQFVEFVKANFDNPRAEFYIPLVVNNLMERNLVKVSVLDSDEKWYGVTYKEDKEGVMNAMNQFANEGKYPIPLWP